jgi:3-deoxy-D-manno-octulosonic-acid transferase
MLSSIYQFGNLAYIGGGFGSGIHNILEAGVAGIPVIFGPEFKKFKEAVDTLKLGCSFSVATYQELLTEKRTMAGNRISAYIRKNRGATSVILERLHHDLKTGN